MASTAADAEFRVEAALPARADIEGTRERILLAALELFAYRGYHASSIRDIATAAGLVSASLYSHFESKEAILAELVFIGNDEHQRRLMTALLGAGPRPRDQLAALVQAHVLSHTEFPVLALVANRSIRDLSPAAAAPAVALNNHSAALLTEVLQRGVAIDGFDLDNEIVVSGAIATMGSSVASWWPPRAHLISAQDLADGQARLALRMVSSTLVANRWLVSGLFITNCRSRYRAHRGFGAIRKNKEKLETNQWIDRYRDE